MFLFVSNNEILFSYLSFQLLFFLFYDPSIILLDIL
jgi:hypothetical protein